MAKTKGIDISYWQGTVDFSKVKADGIKFCIFREGFRQTIDAKFLEYVKGATKAGIPILGVYHFSYALNEADAKQEATTCINNLKKAGLGKDVIVFYDFEYDTVKQAKDKGVTLGKKQCIAFTKAFCEQVTKLGYKAGIYSNIDYYKNMYDKDLIAKYVFWLAHYTSGEPAYKCSFQQYTSSGKVKGINGNVDMNYFYGNVAEEKTVKYLRSKVVKIMQDWVGKKESDGSHKVIIDTYNKISPLPVGYKLKYTDAWCAGTVSAAFHKAGYDAIFPSECGCGRMITLAKKMGIWVENDAYKPSPGDCVLYDWQDSGKGDNTGDPDHVGMVEKINGNTITVIEGNYSNAVTRRALLVNGKYIRGFICPKFDAEATKTTTTDKSSTTTKKTTTKASTPSYTVGKTYTIQVDCLNVRTGAGTKYPTKAKKSLTADGQKHSNSRGQLMKGTKVTCLQTKKESGNVWMKIPSGWICAYYAKDKEKYVK